MSSLKSKVFVGAAWMLSMRLIVNSLGIISSIVLARLLTPNDFGLVALAGTAFAFLHAFGHFGFDSALIHHRSEDREYYDSAWTVNVVFGLISAVLLWIFADYVAGFFGDGRISAIVKVFSILSLTKGFENIGFVKFRKALRYDKDFYYFVLPKLISLLVAIPIAYYYRTYWALVIGMIASRLATFGYTYAAHEFRPRFGLSRVRELFGFSQWILLTSILGYIGVNGIQVLIGRFATPFSAGIFSLSKDIGRLPSTEFIQPINRALFPGFSTISNNPARLKSVYLKSMSGIASITVPAAVGIFSLADLLVPVLLGAKWVQVIPVLKVISLAGMVEAVKGGANPLFLATGKPGLLTGLHVSYISIMFPMFGILLYKYDLSIAVFSIPGSLLLTIPQWVGYLKKAIPVKAAEIMRPLYRPVAAAAIMYLALYAVIHGFALSSENVGLIGLIILVFAGAVVYAVGLFGLWSITGRKAGFESTVLELATAKFRSVER